MGCSSLDTTLEFINQSTRCTFSKTMLFEAWGWSIVNRERNSEDLFPIPLQKPSYLLYTLKIIVTYVFKYDNIAILLLISNFAFFHFFIFLVIRLKYCRYGLHTNQSIQCFKRVILSLGMVLTEILANTSDMKL